MEHTFDAIAPYMVDFSRPVAKVASLLHRVMLSLCLYCLPSARARVYWLSAPPSAGRPLSHMLTVQSYDMENEIQPRLRVVYYVGGRLVYDLQMLIIIVIVVVFVYV